MSESTIRWDQDDDGVVVLTFDDPTASANTMTAAYQASMHAAVERLHAERDALTGVVLTSAKRTFFAGANLHELSQVRPEHAEGKFARVEAAKADLRRLETLGRPVVAALNGSALGAGLEIALACHHRIAVRGSHARFGLPEVTLGLLPGGGGTVRTVRMLGLQKALTSLLLQGQQLAPAAALELGIVDELVDDPADLLPAAKRWVTEHPDAVQPWDVRGHRIPGGTPSTPALAAVLPSFPATLQKQLRGAPYPAPRNILAAAVEGSQVDVDTALRIESRYFVDLVTGQTAKNMIKAFFVDMQHIQSGGSRPRSAAAGGRLEGRPARRVAVLGAGMMGAGIAYVCARNGIDVVLRDVSREAAERGKAYSQRLLDSAVAKGRMTAAARDVVLARISPTAEIGDLAGCDTVIEAVFESVALKHQVFQEVEPVVAPDALLCSNTSTLPITGLAEAVARRGDFVGLHFFSPVDKMPLVEIIRGRETSDEALARAYDLTLQIRKTPIVVNDSRGFFTSRVIVGFVFESLAMLGEGVHPVALERAATLAGYPVGPLQLTDELSLDLMAKIAGETRAAAQAEGREPVEHPGEAVMRAMLDAGRPGRARGAGFYDYGPDGRRGLLWPGLHTLFDAPDPGLPLAEIQERLLFAESVDAIRCLEEGVLTSVPDANVGSILGIGFPGWTGGVLQYVNGYPGGPKGFLARAEELAERYGERFAPPDLLRRTADNGEEFV